MENFNELTPAEAERLAMLAEECAEVVQIVGKILRHGYKSWYPADTFRTPNRVLLFKELVDVQAVMQLMCQGGDIASIHRSDALHEAEKKLTYAHHQQGLGVNP